MNPVSTYRIQFNKDFTFTDFEKIIPYLHELGIKTKQFARIVFGVLVVEDIVVILLMVLLSTVAVTQHLTQEIARYRNKYDLNKCSDGGRPAYPH